MPVLVEMLTDPYFHQGHGNNQISHALKYLGVQPSTFGTLLGTNCTAALSSGRLEVKNINMQIQRIHAMHHCICSSCKMLKGSTPAMSLESFGFHDNVDDALYFRKCMYWSNLF
jgi:hypothetical protein